MLAETLLTKEQDGLRDSGFQSLMAALSPSENRGQVRVMPLAAYFDASGHEADQEFVVVAGFVASTDMWAEFERLWVERLTRDGITCFHAVDFESCRREFQGWTRDDARHKALREDLMQILKANVSRKFGHVVINKELVKMSQQTRDVFLVNAYSLGGRSCAANLRIYLDKIKWQTVPEIIFEDGDIGKGKLIETLKRDGFATPIFKPKKDRTLKGGLVELRVVPLQAADWLAYEMFQSMKQKNTDRWAMSEFNTTVGRLGIYTAKDVEALETEMNTPLDQIMKPIEGDHFFVPWSEDCEKQD